MTSSNTKLKSTKSTCQHCLHAPICLLSQINEQSWSELHDFIFSARTLQRGEHLCYQGSASQNLFILRTGILKSYISKPNGEMFVMGFYLPPDLFGWEGIDTAQRSISIIALDQSSVCVIPTKKMLQLSQQSPLLVNQILQMVSRRIQNDNSALLQTTSQQRVATFLLQLTARYHQLGYPNNACRLNMTHQDIANYCRIAPGTISRVFHELEKKKLIKLTKHYVYLIDIPQLRLTAELDS